MSKEELRKKFVDATGGVDCDDIFMETDEVINFFHPLIEDRDKEIERLTALVKLLRTKSPKM